MKYPCKDCLVDAVCIEGCDEMIFFVDSLIGSCGKYLPKEYVLTRNRARRIILCYGLSKYSNSSLVPKIVKTFKEVQKENGNSTSL